MATTLYVEAQALAVELLAELGRPIVFTRRAPASVDLVAGTSVPTPVAQFTLVAAVLPASAGAEAFDVAFMQDVGDGVDRRFAVCSAVDPAGDPAKQPEPGDAATFDGRAWQVLGCTPLNVNGTPVIYSVGFRGVSTPAPPPSGGTSD